MGLDQRPFSICRVTCIAQIFPPILLPSGFSPHLVSPMLSDTAWVSQTAEIAQFISGQALRARSSQFRIAWLFSVSSHADRKGGGDFSWGIGGCRGTLV